MEGSLSSRRISRSEVLRIKLCDGWCWPFWPSAARPDDPQCVYMAEYLRSLPEAQHGCRVPRAPGRTTRPRGAEHPGPEEKAPEGEGLTSEYPRSWPCFTVFDFRMAWCIFSTFGLVDSMYSRSYRRVWRSWLKAGWPSNIGDYIRSHANQNYGRKNGN